MLCLEDWPFENVLAGAEVHLEQNVRVLVVGDITRRSGGSRTSDSDGDRCVLRLFIRVR